MSKGPEVCFTILECEVFAFPVCYSNRKCAWKICYSSMLLKTGWAKYTSFLTDVCLACFLKITNYRLSMVCQFGPFLFLDVWAESWCLLLCCKAITCPLPGAFENGGHITFL